MPYEDDIFIMLKMRGADYVIIHQLAQRERKTVNDWVIECIIDKVLKLQEDWKKQVEADASKNVPKKADFKPEDKERLK